MIRHQFILRGHHQSYEFIQDWLRKTGVSHQDQRRRNAGESGDQEEEDRTSLKLLLILEARKWQF